MTASAQPATGGEASLARNFYFVFDGSGSMAESLNQQCQGDKRFSNRLAGAKWAVEQFMPRIPPDVNLGLWVFDFHGNEVRVPLGPGNRERFLAEVQKTVAGRNTPLTESIEQGVIGWSATRKPARLREFRLVVVTDGARSSAPKVAICPWRQFHPYH
jgi:hypothetical protein